jgi:hypothetical protein
MNKKRSNLKILPNPDTVSKGRLVNAPSRSAEPLEAAQPTQSALAQSFGTQVFSSEEQALEVLVSQVVSRFEDDPEEQAEMREFLNTILETDPVLRSEILAGATIRR